MESRSIVSIEGLVGSGKSTIISELKRLAPKYEYLKEPIDEWRSVSTKEGTVVDVFGEFCRDLDSVRSSGTSRVASAYPFQMLTFITRVEIAAKVGDGKIAVTERSIESDYHIFGEAWRSSFTAPEKAVYDRYYQTHRGLLPPIGVVIYVDTPVNECLTRITQRGRPGESYTYEYLETLRSKHLKYFDLIRDTTPVVTLDGTRPPKENAEIVRTQIEKLRPRTWKDRGEWRGVYDLSH